MDFIDDPLSEQLYYSIILNTFFGLQTVINEGTIADVIIDSIINSSHRMNLKGASLRKGTLKTD